jgi:hypothetical protein
MAEGGDSSDWKSSARGESAWKEERERVADRNAEVRKSGKLEREQYEREREESRQVARAKRDARTLKRRRP